MQMSLSREEVVKVAYLARLRLDVDEIERFTEQLSSIVDYVAQLQEPNTSGIEPMAHGNEITNVFRDDTREQALTRDEALANAPKCDDQFFLVPAVLE
jgi:aspartyl-tRNA(Asn)/glutamyl-tRNA(Gln) amidotransferase subunit C